MVLRSLEPCCREPWQFAVDEAAEAGVADGLAEACEEWAESRSQSCFAETTVVALWQPTPGCFHRRGDQPRLKQAEQSLGSVAVARTEDAGEVAMWAHTGKNVHPERH